MKKEHKALFINLLLILTITIGCSNSNAEEPLKEEQTVEEEKPRILKIVDLVSNGKFEPDLAVAVYEDGKIRASSAESVNSVEFTSKDVEEGKMCAKVTGDFDNLDVLEIDFCEE